jgi:predicted lysophospholipase L1 biosynthesis ABC-type transport system permease subunit
MVAIISEALARKHFPGRDPVGQRIYVNGEREIIGIVADVRTHGLEAAVRPEIYLPYAQKGSPATFLSLTVRAAGQPLALTSAVEAEIWALDKDLPVANIGAMDQIVAGSYSQRRLTMALLGAFATLALALALAGIYGVVSYSVAQRTREIGIRMALGAGRPDVVRLVVGQGLRPVYLGLAAGLAGSFALTGVMSSLVFGVTSTDPATFALAPGLLAVAALIGCLVPARRATKVNPTTALRYE